MTSWWGSVTSVWSFAVVGDARESLLLFLRAFSLDRGCKAPRTSYRERGGHVRLPEEAYPVYLFRAF